MKRFEYVHPAGGDEYTSVKLTPEELEKASDATGWCDVCKGWEDELCLEKCEDLNSNLKE